MDNIELASELRKLAKDNDLIWEVARKKIEDTLVDFRDSGLSLLGRNNGLVIKYADSTPSDIIRLGPEDAVRIGLEAIADHLVNSSGLQIENKESNDQVV